MPLNPDDFMRELESGLTPDAFMEGQDAPRTPKVRGMEKLGALPEGPEPPVPGELRRPRPTPANDPTFGRIPGSLVVSRIIDRNAPAGPQILDREPPSLPPIVRTGLKPPAGTPIPFTPQPDAGGDLDAAADAIQEYVRDGILRPVDTFMRAGSRGLHSTIEGAGGALEAFGDMAGSDILARAGRGVGEFGRRGAAPPAEHMREKAGQSFFDRPELLADPEYLIDLAGTAAGSILGMYIPAVGVAGKAGPILERAGRIAPKLASFAERYIAPGAGALLETMYDAGNEYRQAIQEGASREKAAEVFRRVLAYELPTTVATNRLGLFNPHVAGKLKVLFSGAMEGIQEVAQGVAQRGAGNQVLGKDTPLLQGADVEFLSGLLGGTVVSGGLELAGREQAAEPAGEPGGAQLPAATPPTRQSAPTAPQRPQEKPPARPRGERPAVPSEGPTDWEQRVADARERLAETFFGVPFDQARPADRIAIDELVREGWGGAVQPDPAPRRADELTPDTFMQEGTQTVAETPQTAETTPAAPPAPIAEPTSTTPPSSPSEPAPTPTPTTPAPRPQRPQQPTTPTTPAPKGATPDGETPTPGTGPGNAPRGPASPQRGDVDGGGVRPPSQPGEKTIVTANEAHVTPADTSGLPEGAEQLTEFQRQGAATAIRAMDSDDGAFLLADGTGAGKTPQILTVAKHYSQGEAKAPVLIVSKNEAFKFDKDGQPTGSYGEWLQRLGLTAARLDKAAGRLEPGRIYLATYNDLQGRTLPVDGQTVVVYDESHALKNADSQQAIAGMTAASRAKAVLFASATPADKAQHIDYLGRIGIHEGKGRDQALRDLGLKKIQPKKGPRAGKTFWSVDPAVGEEEVLKRLHALFDRMVKAGRMLKREISLEGVDFGIAQIALPAETHDKLALIERELTNGAGLDNVMGLLKARVLMHQRRQQEPDKIPAVMNAALHELAEGRQVVVFVARVNESTVRKKVWYTTPTGEAEFYYEDITSSEGTAKLLKQAFASHGITDVAEIHGGAEESGTEEMARFQAGKARVVIATMESGGTGINLDDITGNRPRTMLVLTPAFSAVENVQAIGRIWRLSTKSRSRVYFFFGDTAVDQWNADITRSKLRTLGAVDQSDQTGKLNFTKWDKAPERPAPTTEEIEKAGERRPEITGETTPAAPPAPPSQPTPEAPPAPEAPDIDLTPDELKLIDKATQALAWIEQALAAEKLDNNDAVAALAAGRKALKYLPESADPELRADLKRGVELLAERLKPKAEPKKPEPKPTQEKQDLPARVKAAEDAYRGASEAPVPERPAALREARKLFEALPKKWDTGRGYKEDRARVLEGVDEQIAIADFWGTKPRPAGLDLPAHWRDLKGEHDYEGAREAQAAASRSELVPGDEFHHWGYLMTAAGKDDAGDWWVLDAHNRPHRLADLDPRPIYAVPRAEFDRLYAATFGKEPGIGADHAHAVEGAIIRAEGDVPPEVLADYPKQVPKWRALRRLWDTQKALEKLASSKWIQAKNRTEWTVTGTPEERAAAVTEGEAAIQAVLDANGGKVPKDSSEEHAAHSVRSMILQVKRSLGKEAKKPKPKEDKPKAFTITPEMLKRANTERTAAEKAYSRSTSHELTVAEMEAAIKRADDYLAEMQALGFTPKESQKGENQRTDVENLRHDLYWVKAARGHVAESLRLFGNWGAGAFKPGERVIMPDDPAKPLGTVLALDEGDEAHKGLVRVKFDDRSQEYFVHPDRLKKAPAEPKKPEKPKKPAAPKRNMRAELPEFKFSGLAGRDGRTNGDASDMWGTAYDRNGDPVAEVTWKRPKGGESVITVEIAKDHQGKPYTRDLERYVRWLVERYIESKPVDLHAVKQMAATWRAKWHEAKGPANRQNVPRDQRAGFAHTAEQALEMALRMEAHAAELEAGPEPEAAAPAPPASPITDTAVLVNDLKKATAALAKPSAEAIAAAKTAHEEGTLRQVQLSAQGKPEDAALRNALFQLGAAIKDAEGKLAGARKLDEKAAERRAEWREWGERIELQLAARLKDEFADYQSPGFKEAADAQSKAHNWLFRGEDPQTPEEEALRARVLDLYNQMVAKTEAAVSAKAKAYNPQLPAKHVLGDETTILIPAEDTTYKARYAVIEAAELQPSHSGVNFAPNPRYGYRNDRNYDDPRNQARILEQERTFTTRGIPALLTDNPDPVNGPPMLYQGTSVAGGNSRAMTIHRVLHNSPDVFEQYTQTLFRKAEIFGIDRAKLRDFEAPVLVRVIIERVDDVPRLVTDLNKTGTAALTPAEQALADSRGVSAETLEAITNLLEAAGPDATVNAALSGLPGVQALDRLIADGVISGQDRSGYLTEQGVLTADAKDRVEKLLLGRLFETPKDLEVTPPSIRQKLLRTIAPLARLNGRGEWDLGGDMRQAARLLTEMAARHITRATILINQPNLDGEMIDASPRAIQLAQFVQDNGQVAVGRAFKRYAQEAEYASGGGQSGFFAPMSREEAWSVAFEGKQPEGGALFMRRPPAGLAFPRLKPWREDYQSYAEILRDAQVEQRGGVIYANRQALMVTANAVEGSLGQPEGITLNAAHVQTALGQIERELRQLRKSPAALGHMRALKQIAQALRAAEKAGGGAVVMVDTEGTAAEIAARLRHEFHHIGQHDLGGKSFLVDDARALLRHPLALIAAPNLRSLGYEEEDLVAEIGAHLDGGPAQWAILGLTREEARELYRAYFRAVVEAHGRNALLAFQRARRTLREALTHATETNAGGSRSNPRQPGRGPAGLPSRQLRRVVRPEIPGGNLDLFAADDANAEAEASRRRQIDGDRLTAEFNSPLNRGNLRTRLKPQTATGEDLFGLAAPEQSPLFMRRAALRAIAPAAELAAEIRDDFRRAVNPVARGRSAVKAALSLREWGARAARDYDQAKIELRPAKKVMRGWSLDQALDFIDAIETDDATRLTPELQGYAETMRRLLDERRFAVQALGTGKLQTFYETYFPHVWKRRREAADTFRKVFARRPIEGPKAFLKKRKFQSFREGVEAGLEPVSTNPVDLVMLKLREMDRYLLAHRFLAEMKARKLARFVSILKIKSAPEGWVEIPDPIGSVWGPPHIRIPEAHDKQFMDALLELAGKLGMKHQRVAQLRGAWGRAYMGRDRFKTRFAGPESVILHEIGHLLDARYDLAGQLVKREPYADELRKLADLRLVGNESRYFQRYVRKGEEKIANMVAAYRHAPERFKQVAPLTFAWFDAFVQRTPELRNLRHALYGMQLRADRIDYPVGGIILRGKYFMPEAAAQVVKNYLEPGLRGKAAFRVALNASNTLLQFNLGFSAFHGGFTTYDAMVSKLALGLEQALAGKPAEAIRSAVTSFTPYAAVENVRRGSRLKRAWDLGADTAELQQLVDALVAGGGRVRQDDFYRTGGVERFLEIWRENPVWAVLNLPVSARAAADAVAKPIMEWLVPRQKLGVFADLMTHVLEDLGPDATQDEIRAAASKVWDSVDNRLGQVVYDNAFMSRTAKDIGMLSIQSLGWNLGTFREIGGGGLVDPARAVRSLMRGQKPEFTHRTAYLVALVMMTAWWGALITYLATGKGPETPRDYFFPQTGGVDEDGHPSRMVIPGYMKDIFHWAEDPLQAARNKLNPLLRLLSELASNQDFFGVRIRNENDPLVKQALDLAAHIGKAPMPYAVGGLLKERARGGSLAMQALPFVGVTAAPAYINRTPAQRRMADLLAETREVGGQSRESFDRMRLKREMITAIKRRDRRAVELAREGLRAGVITGKDVVRSIENAGKDRDLAQYNRLDIEGALDVYRLAGEDERVKFRPLLLKKLLSAARNYTPAAFEALRNRFEDVIRDAVRPKKKAS